MLHNGFVTPCFTLLIPEPWSSLIILLLWCFHVVCWFYCSYLYLSDFNTITVRPFSTEMSWRGITLLESTGSRSRWRTWPVLMRISQIACTSCPRRTCPWWAQLAEHQQLQSQNASVTCSWNSACFVEREKNKWLKCAVAMLWLTARRGGTGSCWWGHASEAGGGGDGSGHPGDGEEWCSSCVYSQSEGEVQKLCMIPICKWNENDLREEISDRVIWCQ